MDINDTYGDVHGVAQQMVDMIVMSYRFDNNLVPERGIGKIFDAVILKPRLFYCNLLVFLLLLFFLTDTVLSF